MYAATPADRTPADSTPADSTPSDSTPSDSAPADSTPSAATPADRTSSDDTPSDGDPIVYRFTNEDGTRFEFNNYYLSPGIYHRAFEEAGFSEFHWIDPRLHPSEQDDGFWDEFMAAPPVIGFAAVRA